MRRTRAVPAVLLLAALLAIVPFGSARGQSKTPGRTEPQPPAQGGARMDCATETRALQVLAMTEGPESEAMAA